MELDNKIKNEISLTMVMFLTFSGGLMDAYSYINRGKVFSNAQTGNLLLLGVNLSLGNFDLVIHYLMPVLGFIFGIFLAVFFKNILHKRNIYFEIFVLIIEIMIMIEVMFIPYELNLLATSLLSLACGMQVEAFRRFQNHPIATTMCIGNLRAGVESLVEFIGKKEKKYILSSLVYFSIIIDFILGAVVGNFLIEWCSIYSIGFSGVVLFICLILLLLKKNEKKIVEKIENEDLKNN